MSLLLRNDKYFYHAGELEHLTLAIMRQENEAALAWLHGLEIQEGEQA